MKTFPATRRLLITIIASALAAWVTASSAADLNHRNSPIPADSATVSSNLIAGAIYAGQPLSFKDIKVLSRLKVDDDTIITAIEQTHSVYWLDARNITRLEYAGVSDPVIEYMIGSTTNLVFNSPPPPRPAESMVTAPGFDFVWIPGEWMCPQGEWVWVEGGWTLPPTPTAHWSEASWKQSADGWHRAPGRWH